MSLLKLSLCFHPCMFAYFLVHSVLFYSYFLFLWLFPFSIVIVHHLIYRSALLLAPPPLFSSSFYIPRPLFFLYNIRNKISFNLILDTPLLIITSRIARQRDMPVPELMFYTINIRRTMHIRSHSQ